MPVVTNNSQYATTNKTNYGEESQEYQSYNNRSNIINNRTKTLLNLCFRDIWQCVTCIFRQNK